MSRIREFSLVTSTSGSTQVQNKPKPQPSIDLAQGNKEPGYSHSFTYDVTLHDFPANRTFQMQVHCNGGTLWAPTISTDGNGYAHYRGAADGQQPFCGYQGAYVVVNGVQSSVQDWSP